MSHLKENYTGIILCGGQSSRLGTDKGLLKIGGITMAERAIRALSFVCDRILISTNREEYASFGYPLIQDVEKNKGPMMGIYSCLKASNTVGNLIMAVDNLHTDQYFYEFLALQSHGYDAVVPFLNGKFYEPLAAYYSKNTEKKMEEQMNHGNYKLPDLFHQINIKKLKVEEEYEGYFEGFFRSLNYPEDLAILGN